jgi:hypothetical protein
VRAHIRSRLSRIDPGLLLAVALSLLAAWAFLLRPRFPVKPMPSCMSSGLPSLATRSVLASSIPAGRLTSIMVMVIRSSTTMRRSPITLPTCYPSQFRAVPSLA